MLYRQKGMPGALSIPVLLIACFLLTAFPTFTAAAESAPLGPVGRHIGYGYAVAVDGDTAVVGAWGGDGAADRSGVVFVLERDQGGSDAWGEVKSLTGTYTADSELFGYAVAIDGDTIVVGAWIDSTNGTLSGAAYVFERNLGGANNWGQAAHLSASDASVSDLFFGETLAIDGDTIVVGARENDTNSALSGAAYVFERNQGGANAWGETAKLVTDDGESDTSYVLPVAVSGATLIVGAPGIDVVYVFERTQAGAWNRQTTLAVPETDRNEAFSRGLAIEGATIVVGDEGNKAFHVFKQEAGVWSLAQTIPAPSTPDNAGFGRAVMLEGNTLIVGAPFADAAQGAAYVFEHTDAEWRLLSRISNPDPQFNDFGEAVAISQDTIVIGAPNDILSGNQIQPGAAYRLSLEEVSQPVYRIYLPLL